MKTNRLDDQMNSILIAAFLGLTVFTATDVLGGGSFGRHALAPAQTVAQSQATQAAAKSAVKPTAVVAKR